MDLRKRLVLITLAALLVAVVGASVLATFAIQQQTQQQTALREQRQLVGASNIAFNAIQDEVARIQVAARYLAVNPEVNAALRRGTPGAVQDSVLEPYRRTESLSFVGLVTNVPRAQIAQAKALSPAQVPFIWMVDDALHFQQDRAGIWDGPVKPANAPVPQVPYAVAASPVLAGNNTLLGVVVVGRVLDNAYIGNVLTPNLGDFDAVIVDNRLVLAMPATLGQAFSDAKSPQPYRAPAVPVRRLAPLPSAAWQAATWQIGASRYLAVIRPLGAGSNDQLAIAQPGATVSDAPAVLTPLSIWLAQRAGMSMVAAFGLVTQVFWWLAALLLLALSAAAAAVAIQRALRPIRSLTARLDAFQEQQAWQPLAGGPGEFGRLQAAVSNLAGEATGWLHELGAYRGRLQSVLDSMSAGVVVSGDDGQVELINPAARELLGLEGGSAALPVPAPRSGPSGQAFQASNGRVINAVSTPIRRNDGHSLGLVTVLEDMTRERELERVRSDFLTVVSHELRTPLTAVKGSLDLLFDGEAGAMDPLQQRFLQTARRNAERLITLVNDLLDLSRLEAGQVRLALHPADLRRVVDDVVIGLGTIFDRKGQEIRLELPMQPLLVLADRRRFEQVVTNLLGNAATYTPEQGEISVMACADPDAGQAVLTVRNSGPGIAPEDREHLFEKFYRGGNALTRQDGGSGLGLSIVKSLVDLHHGTISVESEPGQGAAFVVRLPLAGDERENTGRR